VFRIPQRVKTTAKIVRRACSSHVLYNLRLPKNAQVEDDVESIPIIVDIINNNKKIIVALLISVFSIKRFRLTLIR
jgi:hypothetical protein